MHVLNDYLSSPDLKMSDEALLSLFRDLSNIEVGGKRLYDGTGTHWMQNPREFKDFCAIVRHLNRSANFKIRKFIEIGFATGITHTMITKIFRPEYSVAVDLTTVTNSASTLVANLRFKSLVYVSADSKSPFAANSVNYFAPFDLIFIDGDHTYHGVRRDFEIYSKMVTERAVIVLHDVKAKNPIEVGKFWNELVIEGAQVATLFDSTVEIPYGMGLVFFGFDNEEIETSLRQAKTIVNVKLKNRSS